MIVNYPKNLPITLHLGELKEAIQNNQVVIVCAQTGSGKTTQLPKLLYEMGYAQFGLIGHTQPRKIAAKSICHRISEELNNSEIVSYKIRFQDKTHKDTLIKIMTDGILLQEIRFDPLLKQYAVLIIDEAHERSLNIDFILGYLLYILQKRKDLKIIITSATIDNIAFSKFFNFAPIINIEGATYPVDIVYQSLDSVNNINLDLNHAIYTSIESCFSIELGSVLVFLPGEREIRECINFLKRSSLSKFNIIPLFSRQNEKEQQQIFLNLDAIKIIVSTNIAETSITIPNIKYVIDSGLMRVKRYNSRYKIEQLLLEKIPQSSAKQRAGRAGRTSHGMCIRLYSFDDFNTRPHFPDPEILRSNLANVILKLLFYNLGVIENFHLLNTPTDKAIKEGYQNLWHIKAIDQNKSITKIGKQIADLPLDVNLGCILINSAINYNSLSEILIIVSFLAISDPREYEHDLRLKIQQIQSIWIDKDSEFITILNLWDWYNNILQAKYSKSQINTLLRKHYLSITRMRDWLELHRDLKEQISKLKYFENKKRADYALIHQAILTGFINNVGQKDLIDNFYLGTNSKKFYLYPNSQINKAKWICCAEIINTSKLYSRINAKIDPLWLIPITKHLVKYSYANEHWDQNRGDVISVRSTLLFGLVIAKDLISYGNVNSQVAKDIFIREALIACNLKVKYPFILHNQNIIDELILIEDKLRFSSIMYEEELYKHYQAKLSDNINNIRNLETWLKDNADTLLIDKNTFLNKVIGDQHNLQLFPDTIFSNTQKIHLQYIFDPSNKFDGINAFIQLNQLNLIIANDFEWLVLGYIRDKIQFILKALIKKKYFVVNQINNFITKFLEQADITKDFNNELIKFISLELKVLLDRSDIEQIELPTYLRMHFTIVHEKDILYSGDSIYDAKNLLYLKLQSLVNQYSKDKVLYNITTWRDELSNILTKVQVRVVNEKIFFGYYALVIENNQINLKILNSLEHATNTTKKSYVILIKLHLKEQVKFLQTKKFIHFKEIALYLRDIYNEDNLINDSISFLIQTCLYNKDYPTTQDEFDQLVKIIQNQLTELIPQFSKLMYAMSKLYFKIKQQIINHPLEETILLQLDDLLFDKFLFYIKFTDLSNYPRYLNAIIIRLEKYFNNPKNDIKHQLEIDKIYNAWYDLITTLEEAGTFISDDIYNFRYKIEELRISFFAQEIKTLYIVSSKRLWALFEELKTRYLIFKY